MADRNEEYIKKWEANELVRRAIREHEIEKEQKFVMQHELTATKNELLRNLSDSEKDLANRVKDLENDSIEVKDRNKWLFRLVVGSIIVSLIPILIALLSQSQGNVLQ